jgi:hypothetical protein
MIDKNADMGVPALQGTLFSRELACARANPQQSGLSSLYGQDRKYGNT